MAGATGGIYGSCVLIGRAGERARIELLLEHARDGRSGALVIRGEPGIGKTTLLLHARDSADGMSVVAATGVEAEAELEYSGLLELVRPLLGHLDELPSHQAEALREALGFEPPRRRDPFAIGAAVLSLLAAAAEERPLLVVADDVQWLDRATTDALRFAARRLLADRVAILLGVRDGEDGAFDARGFDVLELVGLDAAELGELLEQSG
ncbi:MAG TPA: ATP-binding protein, partial [Gaiellaceae bacterium]|nr:ATP-binding protein [Gaiellaceae bacterium]